MLLQIFGISGFAILFMMSVLWLISFRLKDASIVDIFWGIGFVIITWLSFTLAPGYLPRKQLVMALVTIWGLRLAVHIARRNRGKGEDFRTRSISSSTGTMCAGRAIFIYTIGKREIDDNRHPPAPSGSPQHAISLSISAQTNHISRIRRIIPCNSLLVHTGGRHPLDCVLEFGSTETEVS